VDPSYRIQSNSGTVDPAATSFTPALPNPTTDGSTLLLFIGTASGIVTVQAQGYDPPWITDGAHASTWYAWRRDSQPAGETSWPMSASLTGRWSWRIEEWSGLSTVGQPDAVSAGANISIGLQDNPTLPPTADVDDFAALTVFRASGGTAIWPAAHTYSSGWTEVASVAVGTGTVNTDFLLLVAESYPGAAGSVPCTMTWDTTGGGTYADKAVDAWTVIYQPDVPLFTGVVLT
jgi:hypothetical protein